MQHDQNWLNLNHKREDIELYGNYDHEVVEALAKSYHEHMMQWNSMQVEPVKSRRVEICYMQTKSNYTSHIFDHWASWLHFSIAGENRGFPVTDGLGWRYAALLPEFTKKPQ